MGAARRGRRGEGDQASGAPHRREVADKRGVAPVVPCRRDCRGGCVTHAPTRTLTTSKTATPDGESDERFARAVERVADDCDDELVRDWLKAIVRGDRAERRAAERSADRGR